MKLVRKTTNPTGKTHSATVIFFHGAGSNGMDVYNWVKEHLGGDMEFPHIKIIYPTAPVQAYTPADGDMWTVWFDRREVTIESRENRKSLASIYETVHELINEEKAQGIPVERIIVGGYSMGATLSLHTAYHLNTDLAGVFACSTFLNRGSIVYDSLKNRNKPNSELPELIMYQGETDTVVPIAWAKETFENLRKLGVTGKFTSLPNTEHELTKRSVMEIREWIKIKLPPVSKDLQNKL